jgi:hypothetical protein
MQTDVPQRSRAKKRIHDRMDQHVCV